MGIRKYSGSRTRLIYNTCLIYIGVALAAALPYPLSAQKTGGRAAAKQTHAKSVEAKYLRALDSLRSSFSAWEYNRADTLSNPYYAQLFGSPSFYASALDGVFLLDGQNSDNAGAKGVSAHAREVAAAGAAALCDIYTTQPWLICHEEAQRGTLDVEKDLRRLRHEELPIADVEHKPAGGASAPVLDLFGDTEIGPVVRRPNFWTFKAGFSLQFTQSHVSENWYKGGESNLALLASTTMEANYNNQKRLTFDNKLEMKLGFQTSQNDEEHKYKTNSDLLRLTNKLGLRAAKNWYYTAMLQSWTQFYKGYKSNDTKIYSDFFSPFESLLSLGMDYQLTLKRFKVSATLSPLALKLKHVSRDALITSFGLEEGKHTKVEYGSNITVNYKWEIIRNVSWTSRLYFFTDYHKTQVEWENTFDLSFTKYLSARLFLYPRFDDSVNRKDTSVSFFQFNELLSLGLNVTF